MPQLAHLMIYPIKALDGVAVTSATILPGGGLKHDREFALVDAAGKVVNGKRTAKVHLLRSSFDLVARTVSIAVAGAETPTTFHLDDDRSQLAAWLSDYFEYPIQIIQNTETGFPDDLNAPGPTIVSTATLTTLAAWYDTLSLEDMRRRFRTNLEIDAVPAFWEDRLFSNSGEAVPFTIGEVEFQGINPCQRCVVITRDAQTGEAYPNFQKTFVAKRQATLPDWAAISRFNHFYRLAINTRIANQAGKVLRVGDSVHYVDR